MIVRYFYEKTMPIYEYLCHNCGKTLEKLQKMSDDALTTCPSCQQETLKKQVSAAGFRLKGTGWYATDFKNKPKPATQTTKAEAKTETKSETKSETITSNKSEV